MARRKKGVLLALPVGLRRQRRVVVMRHAWTGCGWFVIEGSVVFARPVILFRVALPGNEHWETIVCE